MKFVFVTESGDMLGIALRVKEEGHKVLFYIQDEKCKTIGDGLIDKIDDWHTSIDDVDCFVFDMTGFSGEAEMLRRLGKNVYGGAPLPVEKLETDRKFGKNVFTSLGIRTPKTQKFQNYDYNGMIDYIKNKPDRYVLKPDGADAESWMTYVGQEEDGADVIAMIKHIKQHKPSLVPSWELQEYVEGIEFSCGGFFNGEDFISPLSQLREHKKFWNDDLGFNTGEMGSVNLMFTKESKLYKETTSKIVPYLRKYDYRGLFDLNSIITEDGTPYVLEATARGAGYPWIYLLHNQIPINWGDFLYCIASGEDNIKEIEVLKGFSIGVVLCAGGFPSNEEYKKQARLAPVLNLENVNPRNVYPVEVSKKGDNIVLDGEMGYAFVVCSTDESFTKAQSNVYSIAETINFPGKFYRTDIGDKFYHKELDILKNLGYIKYALMK